MALLRTYPASGYEWRGWTWTGVNTLNQVASYIDVTEPIIVSSISCYWGGYQSAATGRHAIWASDGSIVQYSGWITVPEGTLTETGQSWNTASITETFLDAGRYWIGFYCKPDDRRVWSDMTPGVVNDYAYRKTTTSGITTMSGYDDYSADGVLAAYLTYEPAGRVNTNVAGAYKVGNVYTNVNGSWTRSKGVYTNVNGTWQQSK